jgi:hypothetical protein
MFKRGIESRMRHSKLFRRHPSKVHQMLIAASLTLKVASKLFQRHQITELAAKFRRSPDPE